MRCGDFAWNERGRRENKLKRLNLLELSLEGFKGADGEARRCDLELRSGRDRALQVIAGQVVDVVEYFHRMSRPAQALLLMSFRLLNLRPCCML